MTTPWPPGPWKWFANGNSLALEGRRDDVMRFRRWGMSGAAPEFFVGRLWVRADELLRPIPGREHHTWARRLVHPVAQLIEAAPELYAALEELVTRGEGCPACGHEGRTGCGCLQERGRAALAAARGER